MSAQTPTETADKAEGSLEAQLASIRRMIDAETRAAEAGASGEVLLLTEALDDPPSAEELEAEKTSLLTLTQDAAAPLGGRDLPPPPPVTGLLSAAAEAAASESLRGLVQQVQERRSALVPPPGPMADELHSTLRPLLQAWLDQHLPAIVERTVRTEVRRLVERVQDA